MPLSAHSMNVDHVTTSSTVYWYLIVGAVLLALAMGPVLHGDPAAALGTSVGMLAP